MPELETAEQAASPCRTGQYTRVTYFSDSTKTVEVGHLICGCTGTTTTYGQTTTFTTVSHALCSATDIGTAEQAIIPQCRVGQNTRIFFYNDAAKTEQIGQRVCSCSGTVTTTGRVSSVWSRSEVPCNP
ncbi:hypothetical protein D7W81_14095 [Corallococcus aberystwythensis]|uniref:Uncharacterized protein n=1 Tax=Corallococcus aberystwythensis TaxID=2316722 RepID=A0A3A8QQV2_9BACT|nr:hypothetical protein D7W81_14095 [Corallococcus aberystwythensis]